MEIKVRNAVDALHKGTGHLIHEGKIVDSRGGRTLEYPEPVYTTYYRPDERVIFSPARDANPFLHFFEALWMLAGRDDLKFMEYLSKNFVKYSDDGRTMQGSYGYRWRHLFGYDQLGEIITRLKTEPDTRRAVLTMWDPNDLIHNFDSTDIPCNTSAYFKIRNGELHMTVNNRSNDMLWGAYGANVVHMSMLQEYVAANVEAKVGRLIQQSDSFHVYLEGEGGKVWNRVRAAHERRELWDDPYFTGVVKPYPMFMDTNVFTWHHDLERFFDRYDHGLWMQSENFVSPFYKEVVVPMWNAYETRDIHAAEMIQAQDWRKAATEWLQRRSK